MKITSYQEAAEYIGENNGRAIEGARMGNTSVERRNATTIAVRYHHTDIVTFHADGTIVLDSGGWTSASTKQRMSAFLPAGWGIWQQALKWYLVTPSGRVNFGDTITLLPRVGRVRQEPERPQDAMRSGWKDGRTRPRW